jgi:hypothetical protein
MSRRLGQNTLPAVAVAGASSTGAVSESKTNPTLFSVHSNPPVTAGSGEPVCAADDGPAWNPGVVEEVGRASREATGRAAGAFARSADPPMESSGTSTVGRRAECPASAFAFSSCPAGEGWVPVSASVGDSCSGEPSIVGVSPSPPSIAIRSLSFSLCLASVVMLHESVVEEEGK